MKTINNTTRKSLVIFICILAFSCIRKDEKLCISKKVKRYSKEAAKSSHFIKNFKFQEIIGCEELFLASKDSCSGLFSIVMLDRKYGKSTLKFPLLLSGHRSLINNVFHEGQYVNGDSIQLKLNTFEIIACLKENYSKEKLDKITQSFLYGSWVEPNGNVHWRQ